MIIIDINNCQMETVMRHPELRGIYWGSTQQAGLFKVCMIVCRNPDMKVLMQRDEEDRISYQQITKFGRYRLT